METNSNKQVRRLKFKSCISANQLYICRTFSRILSLVLCAKKVCKTLFVLSPSLIECHQLWKYFVSYKAHKQWWFCMGLNHYFPSLGIVLIKILSVNTWVYLFLLEVDENLHHYPFVSSHSGTMMLDNLHGRGFAKRVCTHYPLIFTVRTHTSATHLAEYLKSVDCSNLTASV